MKSQLHGKISAMKAKVGLLVKKGDILFSLDAMKIENKVTSAYDGVIKEVKVKEGDQVQINQLILILEEGKISNIT